MVNFEDGELVKGAYVVIDGKEYEVHMPQYSGRTPLSSENLNKMQNDLNETITEQGKILNDKITNATAYSTKEIDTGMKWIDNKVIYRRVLTATKVVSTDLNINVGNNIDTMLVISARLDGPGHYVLPFYESEQVYCRLELDGNNIKVKSGSSGYAQGTVTLIVEYTKTV